MKNGFLFPAVIALLAVIVLTLFGISTYADWEQDRTSAPAEEAATPRPTAPAVDFANPAKGATEASLTVIVYGDYQCAACAQMEGVLDLLLNDFPSTLRVIWKDLPNASLHEQAMTAAVAARCAGNQGAFWPYHDRLFANQSSLADPTAYVSLTEGLVADLPSFKTCLAEEQTRPMIQRDVDEAVALGVNATPYLFVGDRRLSGALDYSSLKLIVSSYVTSAEKDGAVK